MMLDGLKSRRDLKDKLRYWIQRLDKIGCYSPRSHRATSSFCIVSRPEFRFNDRRIISHIYQTHTEDHNAFHILLYVLHCFSHCLMLKIWRNITRNEDSLDGSNIFKISDKCWPLQWTMHLPAVSRYVVMRSYLYILLGLFNPRVNSRPPPPRYYVMCIVYIFQLLCQRFLTCFFRIDLIHHIIQSKDKDCAGRKLHNCAEWAIRWPLNVSLLW